MALGQGAPQADDRSEGEPFEARSSLATLRNATASIVALTMLPGRHPPTVVRRQSEGMADEVVPSALSRSRGQLVTDIVENVPHGSGDGFPVNGTMRF